MSFDVIHPTYALRDLRPGELRVTVRQYPTNVTVIARGELDLDTARRLRVALAGRTLGRQDLTLDLSGLSFIDSTGLHLLLELRRHARRNATALRLVINEPVARVLETAGMTGLFDYALRPPAAPAA